MNNPNPDRPNVTFRKRTVVFGDKPMPPTLAEYLIQAKQELDYLERHREPVRTVVVERIEDLFNDSVPKKIIYT